MVQTPVQAQAVPVQAVPVTRGVGSTAIVVGIQMWVVQTHVPAQAVQVTRGVGSTAHVVGAQMWAVQTHVPVPPVPVQAVQATPEAGSTARVVGAQMWAVQTPVPVPPVQAQPIGQAHQRGPEHRHVVRHPPGREARIAQALPHVQARADRVVLPVQVPPADPAHPRAGRARLVQEPIAILTVTPALPVALTTGHGRIPGIGVMPETTGVTAIGPITERSGATITPGMMCHRAPTTDRITRVGIAIPITARTTAPR